MPKQIKAAVNTNVPTTKVDITAPVMPDIDSWKMAKDVKVQYSTDRTFELKLYRVVSSTVGMKLLSFYR